MCLYFYGGVFVLAGLIHWFRCGSAVNWPLWQTYPRSLGWGLVVGLCISGICRAMMVFSPWRRLVEEIAAVLGDVSLVDALILALSSGFAEEALFRGALQPWLGLWIAALLFGLVHYPLTPALRPWPVFAVAVGLVLGYLSQMTGSWMSAAVAHAVVNFVNVLFLCGDKARKSIRNLDGNDDPR